MQVIITRPTEDAGAWLARLTACADWQREWQPRLWPLIDIGPNPLHGTAHSAPGRIDAAMFVSANAVRFFEPAQGDSPWRHAVLWHEGAQAWAVGPSTRDALRSAGWPDAAIVAPDGAGGEPFDSEALWRRVEPALQAAGVRRVLVVRGTDEDADGRPVGRDWLAQRLRDCGVAVVDVAVYQRARPVWTRAQQAAAGAALGDGSVWLISSSMAAQQLRELLPGAAAPRAFARARAVATHARIAQRLGELGWGTVVLSHPQPQAVAASIKSLTYAR
ncbi:MAG: hypothetical protein GAK30_03557 [Paracidovorax wautersii]|uniref:Tetrapyrrole biosynthesis uroporphyrinogen III synthase domain-containing protein n=1 Tax=Paracidovorax wautersii TaxID=1177982 RepID=A0A7V8FKU3_9BURK|nr:MAG: hypothetical protein GAK30_03557 [Paracidovorax wautersii]